MRTNVLSMVVTFCLTVLAARNGWALDKMNCISAHEAAQELRSREQLLRAREQLLICSDESCPALVRADCGPWLFEIDQTLRTTKSAAASPSPSDQQPSPPLPHLENGSGMSDGSSLSSAQGSEKRPRGSTLTSLRAPLIPGVISSVALASAAVLGITGLSQASDLRHSCSPNCNPADVSDVRRKLVIADVSLLVGMGFGALTGWMIWDGWKTRSPSGSREGLSVTATGTSLHLRYAGHF